MGVGRPCQVVEKPLGEPCELRERNNWDGMGAERGALSAILRSSFVVLLAIPAQSCTERGKRTHTPEQPFHSNTHRPHPTNNTVTPD